MKSVGILLRQLRETGRAQLAVSRGKERNYGKNQEKYSLNRENMGALSMLPECIWGGFGGVSLEAGFSSEESWEKIPFYYAFGVH